MCDADPPDPPEIKQPQYMTNPFLDRERNSESATEALRTGRSSLKVNLDKGLGVGFSGRRNSQGSTQTFGPKGNRNTKKSMNLSNNLQV